MYLNNNEYEIKMPLVYFGTATCECGALVSLIYLIKGSLRNYLRFKPFNKHVHRITFR